MQDNLHVECNENPRQYDKRKNYGMTTYVFRLLIYMIMPNIKNKEDLKEDSLKV